MEKADILIIGAGVIGLAIARELSCKEKNIIVLERNRFFGQETSSRNSEVIHGGMYYPVGTLKATLCVCGRQLLYQLCAEKMIPHRKIGKLIVATDKEEQSVLESIAEQGKISGVSGLEFMTQAQLKKIEPMVSGLSALFSRETGIIDSHQLMDYLSVIAKSNGVSVVYDAEVVAIEKNNASYKVVVINSGESVEITALSVINCAGLDSDIIANKAGINIFKEKYNLHYCKGQYFRVASNKSKLINHLVYPVPQPKRGGLGIHATVDLSGSLRLGPDDQYLSNRIKDYSVDVNKKSDFYESVVKFIPSLEEKDLAPDLSGIRPKLQSNGGSFRDFIIREETDKGLPGFINLVGIESPGLTASLSIAKMVRGMVLGVLS